MIGIYRMSIEPDPGNPKLFRVRYNIPNLGFGCEAFVNAETSELLRVAKEAGKEEAKAEIRKLLGVTNV